MDLSSSQDHPTISVVIPLYNHEQYIDAALDSVLAQTVPALEIIVVDDGSSDFSWQKVQQRSGRDKRIIAWSHPNQGAHHTLNAALRRARGEFVSILNSDDCYHPERFTACLKVMQSEPQVDAVCTALTFIDGKGHLKPNPWYEQALSFYKNTGDLAIALINGNFLMTTSNLFIRRRVFAEIGWFANLRYAHDLDFFLRLVRCRRTLVWLDTPLLQYRIHATNTINENVLQVKIEWAAVVAHYLFMATKIHDWTWFEQMMQIADKHKLTRLLLFFFLHLQQHENPPRDPSDWLHDVTFMKFISRVVQ